MTACGHHDDAAAYVLGALPDDEYRAFTAHLAGCEECTSAVASLQVVADTLPLAAPQVEAPPELRERIMGVVRSEADVMAAAGAAADAPPAERPAKKRRWWSARSLALRPAIAALGAVVLLAIGVAGGLLLSGGSTAEVRTVPAEVKIASAPDASGSLVVSEDGTQLRLRNMPAPPEGKVYEVWLLAPGETAPTPTNALFGVTSDGSADVAVPGGASAGTQVLVSAEPQGGSSAPTSTPVVSAKA